MMKILYDYQIFFNQPYGGISRYFFELIKQSERDPSVDCYVSLLFSKNQYMNTGRFRNFKSFSPRRAIQRVTSRKFRKWMEKFKTLSMFRKYKCDLLHPTYYDPYILESNPPVPYVLTIHDMIHEIFSSVISQRDQTAARKKRVAEKAQKIIAVSQCTKRDIMKYYRMEESRIEVVYHGSSFGQVRSVPLDIPFRSPDRYLLYVGSRSLYKNFHFLVEALADLFHQEKSMHLVCAGGGDWSQEETELLTSLGIQKRVWQGDVSDSCLKWLYEHAEAFVFPSIYEGFGIPILEAFSCGCPVILSNRSSLPEVGGEAAQYFDPENASSLLEAIGQVYGVPRKRDEMIEKGYNRLSHFTWEKTARETKRVYEQVIGS